MKIFKLFFALIILTAIFQRCQENDLLETYMLDSDQSLLEWKGLYSQSGILPVVANDIKMKHGRIISGTLTMPISSIHHTDKSHEFYPVIIRHPYTEQMLKDNPTIIFKIREVTLLSGIHPTAVKGANWWIRGDMTMWGQTHQISFPAKIKHNGNDMEVEAKFTLDRMIWGMDFGMDSTTVGYQPNSIVDLHLKGKGSINNRLII
jgi:hypothetical protein